MIFGECFVDTRAKGVKSESQVADFLTSKGYKIICRNYRCPMGELDLISVKDGVLCVTEVKSLTGKWQSDDIRFMVNAQKLARMKKTLSHYLANNEVSGFDSIRFDVASVTGEMIKYYRGDE